VRPRLLLTSFIAVACTSPRPSGGADAAAANESKAAAPAKRDDAGGKGSANPSATPTVPPAATDPSFEVVSKICAGTCGGPFARIEVFRDAAGAVGRLLFDGDLEACSHPPRIYFDGAGAETLTIPMRPVVAGSPEAVKLAADQAAQTEGLIKAEVLPCTDPQMCEAKRTEGFVSTYACASDRDCMTCDCGPVDRPTWERRGGNEACTNPDEECTATNSVCCDGRCALSR